MIFSFQSADIYRGSTKVITDFTWTWEKGQHWLLTGAIGSGKTTIAEALIGHCRAKPSTFTLFENGAQTSIHKLKPHIQYLAFAEDTHKLRFGDIFYYQQRYQAMESDAGLTVKEYLLGKKLAAVPSSLAPLNVEPLLERRFIQLSNGQTRRVRLAKSLLAKPKILILESILTGIDQQTTGIIEQMLQQEAEKGTSILLIGEEPSLFVTHVLELKNLQEQAVYTKAEWIDKGAKQQEQSRDQNPIPNGFLEPPLQNKDWEFRDAIGFDQVTISYQKKAIITDLNWQVKKGEKWILSGPNGSGKSSVISLIYADNPQAYAQKIILFDQPRGSGESIWDIKRKIGFISPELQTYMQSRRNAVDVAAAGFTNTMVVSRKLKSSEIALLRQLFDYFDIRPLAKKPFMDLSTGEQRLVLFIRAVINNAPLLVLDEPFHAMDDHFRQRCLEFLKAYCHAERTLIFVSHLQGPPPDFIGHELKL